MFPFIHNQSLIKRSLEFNIEQMLNSIIKIRSNHPIFTSFKNIILSISYEWLVCKLAHLMLYWLHVVWRVWASLETNHQWFKKQTNRACIQDIQADLTDFAKTLGNSKLMHSTRYCLALWQYVHTDVLRFCSQRKQNIIINSVGDKHSSTSGSWLKQALMIQSMFRFETASLTE